MTTKTYEKIKREIKEELLQEFVFPILRDVKDSDGEYKEEFIGRVLREGRERPIYVYNPRTFLREIAKK